MSSDRLPAEELLKKVGLEEMSKRLEIQQREIESFNARERKLLGSAAERLKLLLEENRTLWSDGRRSSSSDEAIHIEDPIHQQVLIEPEIAPIFRHPIVQRLGHIKQLSFSYLTFPTATHTRLSHSLGVCRNAELALTSIFQRGLLYTRDGVKKIDLTEDDKRALLLKAKVAALLHDLGHGPFGHGLDQYVSSLIDDPTPDKFHAREYISVFLGETIKDCGLDLNSIVRILDKNTRKELEGYDTLISNIIDSPLDVDRMDYLVRDAHMTGLSIGTVNVHALLARMLPFEEEAEAHEGTQKKQITLVFDQSATPYITHLLYARDSMYLNCYEHPMKVVAEKMLIKAIEDFKTKYNLETDDLVLMTDEQLLRLLADYSEPNWIARKCAHALLRNSSFEEVFSIYPKKREAWETKKGKQEKVRVTQLREEQEVPLRPSESILHWESERLSYTSRYITRPREWEESIISHAGLSNEERWKILITVPSAAMFEPKFDEIKILTQRDGKYIYRKLDELTGFWEGVLTHLAVERYSIRVFVSSDLSWDKKSAVRRAAEEVLAEKNGPRHE